MEMISPTRDKKTSASPTATGPSRSWSAQRRGLASILLVAHLSAVFVAPWSSPPPASDLSRKVAAWFTPYLHVAYLNHGYRFFAPDPGPSHLVRYELELPDGSVRRGRFPDPEKLWPRLFYHRYLMLSETVWNVTEPFAERPPGGFRNAAERQAFEAEKGRGVVLLNSIARDLIRRHGARRAILYSQVHFIPTPWDLQGGLRLDDKSLYQERRLGEFGGEGT